MKTKPAVIPLRTFDKAQFKDGQYGRISCVFKSDGGPIYLFKADSGAVFTAMHAEVRRVR